jgi:hypothetical protein
LHLFFSDAMTHHHFFSSMPWHEVISLVNICKQIIKSLLSLYSILTLLFRRNILIIRC